jgi:hypothetical protein
MGESHAQCSTRFNSWSSVFLLYITDLPKITTNNAKLLLYGDDTSIIVTNPSPKDFKINMNKAFVDIN